MRRLVPVLLVLLATCAGVAAASALVPAGHDHAREAADAGSAGHEPNDDRARVYRLADDPGGREPGWGVRVYESTTGRTCLSAGRVDAQGRFGRAGDDGRLVELPPAPDGACADLGRHPLALSVRQYPARGGHPARAVVYGAVARADTVVELRCEGGPPRRLSTAEGRTFLAVAAGVRLDGCTLTVTPAGGDARSYPLGG
jgi:hypothetical protein